MKRAMDFPLLRGSVLLCLSLERQAAGQSKTSKSFGFDATIDKNAKQT